MSDFSHLTVARDSGGDTFFRSVGRALKSCWLTYLDWRLQQLAAKRLRRMSDRELKDVGLTRSQIEFQVRGSSGRHAPLTPHLF